MKTFKQQRGMTMWQWLVILLIGALLLTASIKLIPVYLEYYSVVQILQNMQEDEELKGANKLQIMDTFSKRLDVSQVTNIKKEHYTIKKAERGKGYVLYIEYEVRRSLFGNLDIVASFKRSAGVGG